MITIPSHCKSSFAAIHCRAVISLSANAACEFKPRTHVFLFLYSIWYIYIYLNIYIIYITICFLFGNNWECEIQNDQSTCQATEGCAHLASIAAATPTKITRISHGYSHGNLIQGSTANKRRRREQRFTLPKTNIAPENGPSQKETIVFQPSIFRCYVSFRGCNTRMVFFQKVPKSVRPTVSASFYPDQSGQWRVLTKPCGFRGHPPLPGIEEFCRIQERYGQHENGQNLNSFSKRHVLPPFFAGNAVILRFLFRNKLKSLNFSVFAGFVRCVLAKHCTFLLLRPKYKHWSCGPENIALFFLSRYIHEAFEYLQLGNLYAGLKVSRRSQHTPPIGVRIVAGVWCKNTSSWETLWCKCASRVVQVFWCKNATGVKRFCV